MGSYRKATQHIIDAVAGIAASELADFPSIGQELIHDPDLDPVLAKTHAHQELRFSLLGTADATDVKTRSKASRGTFSDLTLFFFVPGIVDRREQDLFIWDTLYPAVREALLPPETWNRPASGIEVIEPSSFEGIQAEAPVLNDRGDRGLSILLSIRHTNQTS